MYLNMDIVFTYIFAKTKQNITRTKHILENWLSS